ncbi:tRNA (uridine(54)-C5)-methyltransferase TrmA [Litoribrevibacter albus]|uniref:tRNA/tmRNA (uracil-C(5))-methyltransferase n=1 Tax=Litoribrevibacter albus TaxID=1473156 RepID=A0AA37SB83_9GAMM|nr:tRNA (uridine(54)-C5)-methyltransferase TrmA [Litoribrevibacter albus]GLQ31823.1 tRNA/tmRNA (uracil-C(5))-methyltransferase [Litoribrevibacter albus]
MPTSAVAPENYDALLEEKAKSVQAMFNTLYQGEFDIIPSQPTGFRMRAEFKVWHQGDDLYYVMYKKGEPKKPYRVDEFLIADQQIQSLMPALLSAVKDKPTLRKKLFQVEFLTTLSGQKLITLIYHRQLDDKWIEEAKALEAQLDVMVIGRARKQHIVLTQDYVEEELTIFDERYTYKQIEGGFTQPNAKVNQQMIMWACDRANSIEGDLLELYCGNGNFTLPLSKCANKVLATEISKTSVRAAEYNIEKNECTNIRVARLSSEEFTDVSNKTKETRRLPQEELATYNFSSVFVDPPRAGLDDGTRDLVSNYDHIIYISCNPETLKRDLESLSGTHEIQRMAMFDQFPYTDHAECGAFLKRR